MAEIFLSYSSADRPRVSPLQQALVQRGFSVFWDQEIPTGTDWDTWIRRHLQDAKCVIVVWSTTSVRSDNVRHEATIAKQQNKLVPVMLEALTVDQFPMGLYSMQATDLSSWSGDTSHESWLKTLNEVQSRLTPHWMRLLLDGADAELVAERSRREAAERRDGTLRRQIEKEAAASQELRTELEQLRQELEVLRAKAPREPLDSKRVAELREQLDESERQRGLLLTQLRERQTRESSGATEVAELRRQLEESERQRRRLEQRSERPASQASTEAPGSVVEPTMTDGADVLGWRTMEVAAFAIVGSLAAWVLAAAVHPGHNITAYAEAGFIQGLGLGRALRRQDEPDPSAWVGVGLLSAIVWAASGAQIPWDEYNAFFFSWPEYLANGWYTGEGWPGIFSYFLTGAGLALVLARRPTLMAPHYNSPRQLGLLVVGWVAAGLMVDMLPRLLLVDVFVGPIGGLVALAVNAAALAITFWVTMRAILKPA